MNIDVNLINKIIKKIINEINSSRVQIVNIVESIRKEQENIKLELEKIKSDIHQVITEVDDLENQDKAWRRRLVEVSSNFNKYNENDIKEVYDKASDIRVKFYTKKNEEKTLRDKRDRLEMDLRKSVTNIEAAEKVINQISIALGYLDGDVFKALDDGDNKNNEMFLGIKILEAQENERKRIARDIHDGPAQHMSNAVMKVDICRMVVQKDIEEGLKELNDLKESVKIALKEVRNIIFDLRPMSLDDLGLSQTIQQTVNNICSEAEIAVNIRIKPVKTEIEPIIQTAVYRIIQEIFNNIKKHSKAKNADVKLDFGSKYLLLVINDDGVGFDVEETLKRVKTKGASYGLIGILDRVNQLQGEVDIKSLLGKGTTYSVKLPVNREVIRDEKQGN